MTPQRVRSGVSLSAVLAVVCAILGAALAYQHKSIAATHVSNGAAIHCYSNQWALAARDLEEQKLVNLTLERDSNQQFEELERYSNAVTVATSDLSRSQQDAATSSSAAAQAIQEQDGRIAALETQRQGMTLRMGELTTSISDLEIKIAETEGKLDTSECDRQSLLAQLKQLTAEKADLQKRMHDLALLRQQVHKLREELSISRRLDWIRRGLYGSLKASELLKAPTPAPALAQNYNLDVELHQNGGANVLSRTNSLEAVQVSP